MFDNWRLRHGRAAFEGKRHGVGCSLNRENFQSTHFENGGGLA